MSENDKKIEEWRDIKGYEGLYQVSNLGRVRSLERINFVGHHLKEIVLKQRIDNYGYFRLVLSKNGVHKTFQVHRLVAQAFIPNQKSCPQINHKDENKRNNNVSNLEWVTAKYNINYGTRTKRAVANTDYDLKTANTDYKIMVAHMDWEAVIAHHNYKAIAIKISKPVIAIDKLGNEKMFDSVKQAGEALRIQRTDISKVLHSCIKTAGGYHFKYVYPLGDHRKISQ